MDKLSNQHCECGKPAEGKDSNGKDWCILCWFDSAIRTDLSKATIELEEEYIGEEP